MDVQSVYNDVRTFLQDFGIWTILVLVLIKFVTGVIVALQKNEFKWFYLGNIFKTDLLKVAMFAIVLGVGRYAGIPEFNAEAVVGVSGAVLVADLGAGVLKNIAHLFPDVAQAIPSAFREPARLRLGNPKNLP